MKNKKLNAIIVDDEPNSVASIRMILGQFCPDVEVLAEADNIEKAAQYIKDFSPALVFLDIDMPRGGGFDLLERFPIRKFSVIFITAYSKYEEKSKKYGAFAYIQKPIDIGLFQKTVDNLILYRKANPESVFRLPAINW